MDDADGAQVSGSISPQDQQIEFNRCVELIKNGQSTASQQTTALLSSLTTPEKLSLLTGAQSFWPGLKALACGELNKQPYILGPLPRLNIPGIRFTDGPRGVVLGKATCFPIAMARGATWDTELEYRVGRAMARESRAQGANTNGAVCINLPRHPAWGRIQETYGEDPVLLGEFGLAITRALQENGIIACVKHYALNSMEDMRFHVDVTVADDVLREVYLPHFEMVVREGKAMSVMSAYNAVNGEWCGQSDVLLNKILRDEWGFKYFTVSDWVFGLRDSVKSLKNGLDLEAPFRQFRSKMHTELQHGEITMDELDRSAARLIATQLELYAERRSEQDPDQSVMLCQEHRDLAREASAKSMVLLKNEVVKQSTNQESESEATQRPLLPIDLKHLRTCAVIGRLADTQNTGDWGSSHVNSSYVVTPYQGIMSAVSAAGGTVTLVASDDESKASQAAAESDFAVVIVGYHALDEGENLNASTPMHLVPFPSLTDIVFHIPRILWQQVKEKLGFGGFGPGLGKKAGGDRRSLCLSEADVNLITTVRNANPNTVVAIIASGAVIMEEWIDDVDAVLMSWYSGCEGGDALADVIFGRTDASGRLPFSIPRDEKDLPSFDATAKKVTYDRWFGQRLLDKNGVTARFPLGHGCSYTSFTMSDLDVHIQKKADPNCKVRVKVTNTGTRAGRHVVQVYGCPVTAGGDFPNRVLLGFCPVDLDSGESKILDVAARTRPLQRWRDGVWYYPSRTAEVEVGAYAGDRALTCLVQLE